MEADLLRHGFVLEDIPRRLSWRAVWVFYRYAHRESAIYRVTHGVTARWGDTEYLLAGVVDLLQMNVWMKSVDGQKGRKRPKPVVRPGDTPTEVRYGTAAMTLEQTKQWLARNNGPR